MATFVEQALGRRAQAQKAQDRPAPAQTPNFAQYRQIRTSEFGDADQWGDDIEDRVAQEYKQTYLPALASQMGLGARPKQEQIDGLSAQFDAAHAQMKQRKAAALGAAVVPPATQADNAGSASASRTWGETLTDTGARALRGAASIGPGLANAGIETLKMGSALAAGLGLISEEDAYRNMDDYRSVQDPLVQGAAEVRDTITQGMMSQGAQKNEQMLANAGFGANFFDLITSPSKLIEQGVQMVGPGVIGAGLGRNLAVRSSGNAAAATARGQNLVGGAVDVAAAREATKALARAGTAETAKAGTKGATAGLVTFAGGSGSASARERFVQNANDPEKLQQLASTEKYQEALQRNNGDHLAALEDLQDEAGMWAFATSAIINGLATKIPGIGETVSKGIASWATPKIGAQAAEQFAARTVQPLFSRITQAWNQPGSPLRQLYRQPAAVLGSNPVRAAAFEGTTEGIEQFAQNLALAKTGLPQDLWEGVPEAAGAGFAVGKALGTAMDASTGLRGSVGPTATPPAATGDQAGQPPASGPGAGPLDPNAPPPPTVEPTEAGQPPTDPAARFAFDTNDVVNRTLELRSELAAPVLENPTPAAVASLLNTKVGRKGLTVLADMEKSIKALANTAKQEGVEYDIATARDAFIDTVATRTGVDPAALRQALLQDAQPANAKPTVVATTPEVAAALRTIPGVEVAGTAAVPTITVNTRAALEAVRANPAAANLDLAKAEEAIGKRIADAQTALQAFADGAVLSPKVRAAEAVGAQIDPAETIGLAIDTLAKSILKQAETAAAGMELASTRAAVDLIVERAAQQLSTRLGIDAAQVAQQIRQGIAERLAPPRAADPVDSAPDLAPAADPVPEPAPEPDLIAQEVDRITRSADIRGLNPRVLRLTPAIVGKALAKSLRGRSGIDPSDDLTLALVERVAAQTNLDPQDLLFATTESLYPESPRPKPAPAPKPAPPRKPDTVESAINKAVENAVILEMQAGLSPPDVSRAVGSVVAAMSRNGALVKLASELSKRDGITIQEASNQIVYRASEKIADAIEGDIASITEALKAGLRSSGEAKAKAKSPPTDAPPQRLGEGRTAQKKRPDSVTPQRLAELSAKARIDPDALTDLEIQDLVIGRMEPVGGVARSDIRITRFSPRGKVGKMVKALERVFGRRVIGLEIEGADLGGFTFPRDHRLIFVNPNATNPIGSVLAHEFAHTLESSNPDLKVRLNQVIGQALGRDGLARYRAVLDAAGRTGDENYSAAQRDYVANSETLADFVSDALSDGRLLAQLYAKDQGLFFEVVQKIREFLDRVLNALRDNPQQIDTLGARVMTDDFTALKSQIEAVIASAAEAGPATRILGTTMGESQWVADATRLPNDPSDLPAFIVEQRREGADLVRQMNQLGQNSLEPEAETRTRMQKFADNWFDTAGPWYRLKVATTKAGIRTVANDVYEAMTRMIGEAGWNVKRDTEQVAQPMATLMQNGWRAKRSDTGFLNFWNVKTERDFIRTLGMVKYAQHAKERNATGRWLASTLEEDTAAERAEILTKYQNGLMSVEDARAEIADIMADPDNVIRENNAWSGLTDKQANEITEAADRYGLTEIVNQLNPFIKEATARTLGYQQQAGNLGARAKRLIDLYGWQNYVPVKGTEFSKDVDASSTFKPEMYIANNFESEVRLTGGRSSSLGAQIIGGVLGDMSRSAYTLSAQNVAKTVEQLAKDGGIPGAQLNRIVQRDTDENGRYLPLTAVKGKDGKVSYPSRGLIALHGDYATEIVLPDKNLITSLERMTRTLGFWGRFGAFANQTLGRLLTGLNWVYWLGALTLDAQATGFALLMKHGPKVAGRYVMNLVKQGLFLQSMRMAFMTNTQLEKAAARNPGGFYGYAYQLKKRGGIAFFGDSLGDPTAKYQGTEAQLAKLVGSKRWKELTFGLPAKAINGLLSIGEGFELAPRVAAYRAMVESGVDPREATSTTKDFMDFNKTGTYGSTAAAAYLFFRPAATGAITTVRQIRDTPNGKKVAIGYAVASMMLYAATIGMMPDEERRKLSKDSLMRNTSFPDGEGGFFQIPDSYGMQRLMGGFGRMIAMVAQGDMEVAEGAFQLVNSIKENVSALPQTNVNPFRPGVDQTEEFKKLFVQLLPTLLRTVVQPGMNMTNQGTPLHIPDAWLGKRFAADAAKPNTPDVYSKLAQSILEGTGTSIDIYPETIKYWADTLGVMGQTINAMSYAQTDANKAGEALGVTDVLASTFGKKFLNRDRQFTPSVRYQNLVNILDRQAKQYERAQELGEPVTPDQRAAVSKVRQLRSQYQRMNKAIRDLPDGPVKEARREAISKWQEAEVERFNRENETRM